MTYTLLRCREHPKYKGSLKPRAKCLACEFLYTASSFTFSDGSAITLEEELIDL